MADLDPVKEAQLFLTSRANLELLVSKKRFRSILNHIDDSIDEEAANDLYQALTLQNNKRLKEANHKIKSELGRISVRATDQDTEAIKENDHLLLQDADRDTLETIVHDLENLDKSVIIDTDETKQRCKAMLKEINDRIDDLSDLKYGKLDFMSSISESYESLTRLEAKLIKKLEG